MTRALVMPWKIVVVGVLAVGLIAGLTLGIQLLTSTSAQALAAELASNSPEVQDALGSESVQVLQTEVRDNEALVICISETGQVVSVEVDLRDEEVTKVTYEAVGEPFLPDPEMEGQILQTATDKLSYVPGEDVAIGITNISSDTVTGGGVYYSVYDLEGNLVAGNGLFLAFEWEPGVGLDSFTWDQANEHGEQVAPGTYVILGKAGDYSDATLISIN
jgi:hypothetical protein